MVDHGEGVKDLSGDADHGKGQKGSPDIVDGRVVDHGKDARKFYLALLMQEWLLMAKAGKNYLVFTARSWGRLGRMVCLHDVADVRAVDHDEGQEDSPSIPDARMVDLDERGKILLALLMQDWFIKTKVRKIPLALLM